MITSHNFPLLMAAMLVIAMGLAQCNQGGGNDKDLEDCSRRGKPQHHRGGGEWSCRTVPLTGATIFNRADLTSDGASYSIR